MEYIQFEKNEHRKLIENLLVIPTSYSSANRRIYISKLTWLFSGNKVTLETIETSLKYFKKLQGETSENKLKENIERLNKVIEILETYSR